MKAKICNVCGKRRVGTSGQDPMSARIAGLCGLCMDEGGWENTHNDSGHDEINKTPDDQLTAEQLKEKEWASECWICHPELNEAANWKPKAKTAPTSKTPAAKATYVRRPQLNHKGHHHPATPKARRTCKEAFWAWAASTEGPKDVTQKHMDAWGQPKPDKLHVLPLGPKGGVINQLKKGKPQVVLAKKAGLVK